MNGLAEHLNKCGADVHTPASNATVPFWHLQFPAAVQNMFFLEALWNYKAAMWILLKKSHSCGLFPKHWWVMWQSSWAEGFGTSQGPGWLDACDARCLPRNEPWFWSWVMENKRPNKVIEVDIFPMLNAELGQAKKFLLTLCYTARARIVNKTVALVQIWRMFFPASEELKNQKPHALSSLRVSYWPLREMEYWLGRPLIDLITFL